MRSGSGFTLIELMVSLVILSFVMVFVMGAIIAQQQAFWANSRLRDAQGQARTAINVLESSVAMAGYGVEPALGLDFNVYAGDGAACATPGAVPPTCTRDGITAPDEIVVYYRDPGYWIPDTTGFPVGHAYTVTAATASSVDLYSVTAQTLHQGQIIQVVCSGGGQSAYVETTDNPATLAAGASTTVNVAAAQAGNPYRQPARLATVTCLASGRAFLIRRQRFYVASYGGTPYLMLDEGINRNDNGSRTDDQVVVAEGIEDFQVAYERPNGGSPAVPALVGAAAGTALAYCSASAVPTGDCADGLHVFNFAGFTPAALADPASFTFFGYSSGSPERRAAAAANVTAIHLAVTARSIVTSKDKRGTAAPLFFNRNAGPAPGSYERASFQTVVEPANLMARGLSYL